MIVWVTLEKHEQAWSSCFLKSLLINMIFFFFLQYFSSFNSVFSSEFVFLPVFLHMSWYIWGELQHISGRNFITILGAQWVDMTVNHSKSFFLYCSILKMMAPVWIMASTPSGWMKSLVLSSRSSILSQLHSERFDHWVNFLFFTDRAWPQISQQKYNLT